MSKRTIKYIGGLLGGYVSFVVILSYKKGYESFNGIPFMAWVIALVLLLTWGIIGLICKFRKKKAMPVAEETQLSFEELLKKEILKDNTFPIHEFRSFHIPLQVEFNDANYAHIQSLIEKGQTDHYNKDEFTNEHTLETMSAARFKAQDNAEYIALFFDPVDYFSDPELLKIYKIA